MGNVSGFVVVATSSSAGKTFIVTALCRILTDRGYRVAPFKPQNMSLNSFPAVDGGEIALAQAMQAYAARIEPLSIMNPILLKPLTTSLLEIVVRGRPIAIASFGEYWARYRPALWRVVVESFDRLSSIYDTIIVEGAGSCAEPNLIDGDIANLRIAVEKKLPAILVADIERGGAFASIIGTLEILPPSMRERIVGIVINKFVGDPRILEPAIKWLESRTGRKVLGVIPKIESRLWPEDAQNLEPFGSGSIDVAVISYPTIANFGDLDPLRFEVDTRVRMVSDAASLGEPDLIILPGCRSTVKAFEWLRKRGLDIAIKKVVGVSTILAICGGAQIAGKRVVDLYGVEAGVPTHFEGLGIAKYITVYSIDKIVSHSYAYPYASELSDVGELWGYEIHRGRVVYDGAKPAFQIVSRNRVLVYELDGAIDDMFIATHLHGILSNPSFRAWLLNSIRKRRGLPLRYGETTWFHLLEQELSKIAKVVAQSIDLDLLQKLLGI